MYQVDDPGERVRGYSSGLAVTAMRPDAPERKAIPHNHGAACWHRYNLGGAQYDLDRAFEMAHLERALDNGGQTP